jgi:hypothetical protein
VSVYAVYVNGYYKSNGTYVNSYERTAPDGNPYNNYSYPGNYNPNTGSITGGNADTYLNNYYNKSSSGVGSSYYPSYVPTTPTCPYNSYYDGIGSCECNYGYAVSGSSCVSQNSLCWDQLGYSSSYDSLSDTCKCSYGYVIGSSGKCTSANSVCSDRMGYMSQYNSYEKKCECMYGYQLDSSNQCVSQNSYCTSNYGYGAEYSYLKSKCICGDGYTVNTITNKCVYDTSGTSYIPISSYPTSSVTTSCPVNSYTSNGNCYCLSGYQMNYNKTFCELLPMKIGCAPYEFTQENGSCTCKFGKGVNGTCLTANEKCRLWSGEYSYSKTENDTNCFCETGYVIKNSKCTKYVPEQIINQINATATTSTTLTQNPSSIPNNITNSTTTPSFTRILKKGMSGNDVKQLQTLLQKINYLSNTQTLSTYFGVITTNALIKFQKDNKIQPSTGSFDPITQAKLISLTSH